MKNTDKTVTIQAWGNSHGIRVTRDMLLAMSISDPIGFQLDVEVVGDELHLSPALTPYQRLMKNGAKMGERKRHFSPVEPEIGSGRELVLKAIADSIPSFEAELEPPTRLHVTPEQQAAVYDYLDYIGHNKTLFLSTHQKLGATGWTKPNLLPLNDLSIDDLGKALFCGMIPDKPSRILEENEHENQKTQRLLGK